MRKVSPWIEGDNCSFRVILGSDPEFIPNRLAFIEKTPRVRIRPAYITDSLPNQTHGSGGYRTYDYLNWAEGFKGEGPNDMESRKWCDDMLRLLGYELEN